MTIPSVVQGTIEVEGKVFELDSPKGANWLESVGSFRFEPIGDNKSFTVRRESGKGGDYWYGYRKQNGKLHKKYIGKNSEVKTARLEEIAESLNTPPQPRVTDKVAEVTEKINRGVTDTVTDARDGDRLTALELQVQALQESLEALRRALPGKSESGDSLELPKVADSELHIEIGNLRDENETLKADYAALLESSDEIKSELEVEKRARNIAEAEAWALNERLPELKSQLETEKTRSDDACEELDNMKKTCTELRSELSDLKQKSATAGKDLPDAADLLNQLKAKRKKSKTDLADMEAILDILEG